MTEQHVDEHPREQPAADERARRAQAPQDVERASTVRRQELHGDEVEEAAPESRPPEFRFAVQPARCGTSTSPTLKPLATASTGMYRCISP
jgi:hypothetical protein